MSGLLITLSNDVVTLENNLGRFCRILQNFNKNLQRNKKLKAYLIVLLNTIYGNRRFRSKNPSSGIECSKILKAINI